MSELKKSFCRDDDDFRHATSQRYRGNNAKILPSFSFPSFHLLVLAGDRRPPEEEPRALNNHLNP